MITVIIPIYNGEKHINRCLDSLLNQINTNFELIVINDGSTDKTISILESYRIKFKDFKIITKENEGQGVGRNIGIKRARGDYLVFIDSDDEVEINYISEFYNMINHNNMDLGITQIKRKFDYQVSFIESNFEYIQNVNINQKITVQENPSLITQVLIAPFAKVIRKDFLMKNGIEFPSSRIYEDLYFTISLLMANPSTVFVDKKTYSYHVRKENTMNSYETKIVDMIATLNQIKEYAVERRVSEIYKNEIEFLAIYHLLIGSMYREWKHKPFSIIKARKTCQNWFKNSGYSTNNKYLKKMKLYCKIYIKFFFYNLK
ncbi:glycosyltransferase family 2 protein [Anaerorhabdus furcosa]|uniref:Glycosyltransferase involved in cell wall bisynthesis n=1 Tax=Anaerorhabdus furcosa TaxID=118967 RepID=A0A1T4LPP6_9FIRM|nr:glycosyltransferase family 2 protein [Anaerorhabdus furcosa]SJZ56665.1 Glycosyltransferase involved in cell wall bisynthesis [Anaerorhabdus furcosa]